ncbi:MAG TPA: RluA family pseudouridine synthase [Candidatus Binatia bacterium]|nr:RluA family pseudouridine synthase [Candidatus Binatia bacterium]
MSEPLTLRVPPLSAPTRLDVFLATSGTARTRSQAKSWIDAGNVRVDGKTRKAGFVLDGGEAIEVRAPVEAPAHAEPEDLPLEIVYEDDELLAIDKPAGMVVHPAPGAWRGTLVNALLHRRLVARDLSAGRPGIVHRLDKETSGILLVARTRRAQEALARAFHDRRVEKLYLAIVLGVPRAATGSLEWTIGRHPRERKRMSIRSRSPRPARTRYALLESFGTLSLLRLEPETGRTHQIRVHLAAMGHPVLADPLYGARKGRALPARGPGRNFPRQALHAAEIRFSHPATGALVRLEAPLPHDMRSLLEELRRG